MNTKEENSQQGKMTTTTPEAKLVVEINYDVLKTLHSLQAELKSFIEDILNKRKETITVLPMMTILLPKERRKEAMTVFKGSFKK